MFFCIFSLFLHELCILGTGRYLPMYYGTYRYLLNRKPIVCRVEGFMKIIIVSEYKTHRFLQTFLR